MWFYLVTDAVMLRKYVFGTTNSISVFQRLNIKLLIPPSNFMFHSSCYMHHVLSSNRSVFSLIIFDINISIFKKNYFLYNFPLFSLHGSLDLRFGVWVWGSHSCYKTGFGFLAYFVELSFNLFCCSSIFVFYLSYQPVLNLILVTVIGNAQGAIIYFIMLQKKIFFQN